MALLAPPSTGRRGTFDATLETRRLVNLDVTRPVSVDELFSALVPGWRNLPTPSARELALHVTLVGARHKAVAAKKVEGETRVAKWLRLLARMQATRGFQAMDIGAMVTPVGSGFTPHAPFTSHLTLSHLTATHRTCSRHRAVTSLHRTILVTRCPVSISSQYIHTAALVLRH